jgi:mRNA interferase RelE/StbE
VSAARQVCYTRFDAVFLRLPPEVQRRIEAKLDAMGLRLRTFPHHRLSGSNRCRLRVGDYRVIYTFDAEEGVLHLLAVGHRREIYRQE